MKKLVHLFGMLALVFATSSAFAGAGEKEIENYVRGQIAKDGSDLKKDLQAKMADYDARHTPDTTTAKAKDYSIKAQLIGLGHGHYRHGPEVTRYLVVIDFEIVRIAEVFPAAYVIEVEKQNFDDGHVEFTATEGHVY